MVKHLLTGANGFVGKTMQAALPCVPLPAGLDLRDRAALSIRELHRDTGWQPLIPIEQSLQGLLNDWEKQLQ